MANAVDTAGSNGDDGAGGGGGGGARPPRLPRWTRQEILVLIQGKKVVESRGRGRGAGRGGGGSGEMGAGALVAAAASPVEPKWASVSSYCRRHGVDRGPVQCRKRWSNLAGDFKKIKEWEAKGKESFWTMRNDLRRERRLPGFFDREVYDILDGVAVAEVEAEPAAEEEEEGKKGFGRTAAAGGEEEEAVFDSGRTAAEDGLFSDFEEEKEAEDEDEDTAPPPQPVAAVPISEKKCESSQHWRSDEATAKDRPQAENPGKSSPSRGGQKRRRTSPDEAEDSDLQSRLIEVLERNSRMLTAQLEAQNMNCQLDRDQRKDQANGLLAVLGKLADALGRIADKL